MQFLHEACARHKDVVDKLEKVEIENNEYGISFAFIFSDEYNFHEEL